MKTTMASLVLAAAASVAPAAMAFQVQDGGISAQEVAKVLQDKGYKAEIGTDPTGDPQVKSVADTTNFTIMFYGCHHTTRCAQIQFQAGFDLPKGMSLDRINAWNSSNRFGRGYLDKDMDPWVEMDLDAEHGFLTEGLANNLDTWTAVLPSFKKFIGF
jgi:hypothetical protein